MHILIADTLKPIAYIDKSIFGIDKIFNYWQIIYIYILPNSRIRVINFVKTGYQFRQYRQVWGWNQRFLKLGISFKIIGLDTQTSWDQQYKRYHIFPGLPFPSNVLYKNFSLKKWGSCSLNPYSPSENISGELAKLNKFEKSS